MSRVVNAQTHGDDQCDTTDHINGQTPEMHESSHINYKRKLTLISIENSSITTNKRIKGVALQG